MAPVGDLAEIIFRTAPRPKLGARILAAAGDSITNTRNFNDVFKGVKGVTEGSASELANARQLDNLIRAGKTGDDLGKVADDVAEAWADRITKQIDDSFGARVFGSVEGIGIKNDLTKTLSDLIKAGVTPTTMRAALKADGFYDDLAKAINRGDEVAIARITKEGTETAIRHADGALAKVGKGIGGAAKKCGFGCIVGIVAVAGLSALFIKAKIDTDRKNSYRGFITKLTFSGSRLTVSHTPGETGVHTKDKVQFCGMKKGYKWLEGDQRAIGSVISDSSLTLNVGDSATAGSPAGEDDSRDTCDASGGTQPEGFNDFCEYGLTSPEGTDVKYCGLMRLHSDFWANVAEDLKNLGKGLANAIGGLFGGLFGGFNFWWVLGPCIAIVVICIVIFMIRFFRAGKAKS